MKSNFHNFNRKKHSTLLVKLKCIVCSPMREKTYKNACIILKKSIGMDFSGNQRCSMNTLLSKFEGVATTVAKDAPSCHGNNGF